MGIRWFALPGYFVAAMLVDKPWLGRVKLQLIGFGCSSFMFFLLGGVYGLVSKEENASAFIILYGIAFFFFTFGANSTTFLLPAEVYACPVRARMHGLSSATGKVGALIAVFGLQSFKSYVGTQWTFLLVGGLSLAGMIITKAFIPDLTGQPASAVEDEFNLAWKQWQANHAEAQTPVPPLKSKSLSLIDVAGGMGGAS